jgi:PRC-barrel domain/EF hand
LNSVLGSAMLGGMVKFNAILLAGLIGALSTPGVAAPTLTKASEWLGHVVTTRDGNELGTVRDFAIDDATGKVVYVVVSVGSYLIENNLIAVAPDALEPQPNQASGLLLVADPALLPKAQRFATNSRWPEKPDVTRDAGVPAPTTVAATGAAAPAAPKPPLTGTATIESPSKTAHLSASERYIKPNPNAPVPVPAAKPAAATKSASASQPGPPPITTFDKLDKDGDGVLNRAEFAHVITPTDSYSKIDANANGVIDRAEFEAFQVAHGDAS